jgi:S-adenosylmethionine:tRNA ribosyltransferase-isomerase
VCTVNLSELEFPYPEELVATERRLPSRILLNDKGESRELSGQSELLEQFRAGDLLVLNETRVLKRRIFAESGLEILFLKELTPKRWEVLCPSSRWKAGVVQILPGGVRLEIVKRARIQTVEADQSLTAEYFEKYGDLPLPPYIQKARGERRNREGDQAEYQTAWAKKDGSLAAPTASLHFRDEDLEKLRERGVQIAKITLHVGLGTFLPITVANLDEHQMHAEQIEIARATWDLVLATRARGHRVWALGTTVVRSLESAAHGLLEENARGLRGESRLFIRPGFEFRAVDVMLTNFHQPRSTLLALVGAFAGLERVKSAYGWAIERKFRLFSYGDLTVWKR